MLAASAPLPKDEQATLDRMSDVAGPLRPRERFEPYLSAYPLPGGERFVLARTWQDLTVARAGCVRTLSLIIPAKDWGEAKGLSAFLELLDMDGPPDETVATRLTLEPAPGGVISPATSFDASELVEALFLEDPKPVVVLGADDPELIAVRLLTALWPSLRRRFAVSTFALSPRKVAGRDFDLMFAPKSARAKFADWGGRRIDGRSSQPARHRWTGAIVQRVFVRSEPRLLSQDEVGLVGGGDPDTDNAAALRIALLWEELAAKLETTPTAALGILDIANSGKVRDTAVLHSIEPSLATAALEGAMTLPEAEAWNFLSAINRKLRDRNMPLGRGAVADATEELAARSPEGAIALLAKDDGSEASDALLPRIAAGVGRALTKRTGTALLNAGPDTLGRLVAASDLLLEKVLMDRALTRPLGAALAQMDGATAEALGERILPMLEEDWHIPLAEPVVARLDAQRALSQLRRLGERDGFSAARLSDLVLRQALSVAERPEVRSILAGLRPSQTRDSFILETLRPNLEDARWLAEGSPLGDASSGAMLVQLMRAASDRQFASILTDERAGPTALRVVESSAPDLVVRATSGEALPIAAFARILPVALRQADKNSREDLARNALTRLLVRRFGGDEMELLKNTLSSIGGQLDGAWVARIGLARDVNADVASRNIIAFRKAGQPVRRQIVWSIAEMARVLSNRHTIDLDGHALGALAAFLTDAEKVNPKGLVTASGHLLPVLFRSRNRPVSQLVAIAFPPVHREFAKSDDMPDLFKLISFFDRDRCKAARHELVDAFMSSSWPAGDLALTACRSNEIDKIIRRVAKQSGGTAYLGRVSADAHLLPEPCRKAITKAIAHVRSNKGAKYDWRD